MPATVKVMAENAPAPAKREPEPVIPPTTSSLGNLFEGIACDSPFELTIVDERDSLFNTIRRREAAYGKKAMTKVELRKRGEEAKKVLFWAVNGVMNMVEKGIGKKVLVTLNAKDIFYGPEEAIVIGVRPVGVREEEASVDALLGQLLSNSIAGNTELHRWMAPELLNGAVGEATEATLSFAIGMVLSFMLTYKVPFEDLHGADAGVKILEGVRPDIECLKGTGFHEVILECVDGNAPKRPTLEKLKREFGSIMADGTRTKFTKIAESEIETAESSNASYETEDVNPPRSVK
jgi:hypothetical protein